MVTILVPVLVAVLGLLVYGFAEKPKPAEVGRILFFCGALALVLMFASKVIHL